MKYVSKTPAQIGTGLYVVIVVSFLFVCFSNKIVNSDTLWLTPIFKQKVIEAIAPGENFKRFTGVVDS